MSAKLSIFRRRRARTLAREGGAAEPARRRGVRSFLWGFLYVLTTTLSFAPTLTFRTAPVRAGGTRARQVARRGHSRGPRRVQPSDRRRGSRGARSARFCPDARGPSRDH